MVAWEIGAQPYAYFGSRGLHAFDFDVNLKWSKDFGRMQTANGFGEGSSPLLVGDKLIDEFADLLRGIL